MAKLLLGKEVIGPMLESLSARVGLLRGKGIVPTLALVRLGDKASDLSYQGAVLKRAQEIGAEVRLCELPEDASRESVLETLRELNGDSSVHGVMLFRPLPPDLHPYEEEIYNALSPEKDLDGMTQLSLASVFTRGQTGFAPCTPEACIRMLDHYGYDLTGLRACVIGRSKVVGRPLAMLLLQRNATVTICHTRTRNLAELCRGADLIVTSAGVLGSLTGEFVSPGQIVLDVSMNWNPDKITAKGKGGMSGDAVFEEVEPVVSAITPVPGGIGAITVPVLLTHLLTAAERAASSVSGE